MDEVYMDFIGINCQIEGLLAQQLQAEGRLEPGRMRPFFSWDKKKKIWRPYINVYTGGDPFKISSYQAVPTIHATLRRDEWKQLDDAILPISRTRLGGVQDLIDNNLVYNLGNALGTTVLEWHDVSDAMEADLTMDGVTRSKGDRPKFGHNYLPIPIIHSDYEINARALASSRKMGNPLDTTDAEDAARKVNEKLEAMLFTNTTYTFGGGTIYSYLNHPNRNTVTLSVNWDASAKTGAQIVAEVVSLKQASINAKHYGPWMLYIPTAYETRLDEDYDTTTPQTTIRERILKIDGIKGVKVVDTLTANNVLLVELNTRTVRLVRGMGIQNVEWQTEGKFITKFKVWTIQVPQVRSDQAGNSGIVHLSA